MTAGVHCVIGEKTGGGGGARMHCQRSVRGTWRGGRRTCGWLFGAEAFLRVGEDVVARGGCDCGAALYVGRVLFQPVERPVHVHLVDVYQHLAPILWWVRVSVSVLEYVLCSVVVERVCMWARARRCARALMRGCADCVPSHPGN